MSLKLRAFDLDIETDGGPFGTALRFTNGLNLISAPNSSGKSTCLQALLYALGLEALFSGSAQRALFLLLSPQNYSRRREGPQSKVFRRNT